MKKRKRLSKKIAATLAAGALLCAGQVFAEEGETVFQLDQVTVTADRTAGTVGKTAANVTVITGEEIKNKGTRTLADALTGVSGVSIKRNGGPGELSVAYVMGSERVVVLLDGKRMNLPQGVASSSAGIDMSTIFLADDIERIEVVRGGASALYGADAVGGVINIITKKGAGPARSTASVAGGNYGGRSYAISAGGQEKNIRWRLSGQQDSSDGQRVNSAYKGKNVSFRLDYELAEKENLTFTYDYYGSHSGLPGSLVWGETPRDFQDILRHNWSLSYTREHAAGSRIFRYYDNEQVYSGWYYDYTSAWFDDYFRNKSTVRTFEYQDSARLNDANLLTWGGEWRKEKVNSISYGNTAHDGTTKALFLQNQYNINSASKVTLGLRYNNNSIYGTHWLPKIAYLYQASANTSYFANWGKVFKAPTFDDLYWYQPSSFMFGNPDLKPETGWTAEIGVKAKINNANEATLSFFKRNLNDAIKWRVDSATYEYRPYNIATYQAIGVNTNLISVLSPAVTTDIGYTYLNSHDQNRDSLGDPRHTFHIGVNIRSGKWKQGIYGMYYGDTGIKNNNVYANTWINSRFVVNTNTSYALSKETSLFLTIDNLFNKKYQASYGYPANKFTWLFGVRHTM